MGAPELSQYYSEKEGDGRGYVNPVTGDKSPSVTTVLKLENKDNLIQWAANLTAQFYAENPDYSRTHSDEQAKRGGQYYWKKFRDERAEVGTGVHEYVEAEHNGSWEYPELDTEQWSMVEQWGLFNDAHKVEPVHSEITLWNHTHDYAGTADGLWYIDGVLRWCDIKTAKNTWPGHWMQLSALKNAECMMLKSPVQLPGYTKWKNPKTKETSWWKEEAMPTVESSAIIHLRADKWALLLAEDEDLRFREFVHYRGLYEIQQTLKERSA